MLAILYATPAMVKARLMEQIGGTETPCTETFGGVNLSGHQGRQSNRGDGWRPSFIPAATVFDGIRCTWQYYPFHPL